MSKTICFIVEWFFWIDIVAWFTWIGQIIAMRMLFNGNHNYHHSMILKILEFSLNFPNWRCLTEPCAYPHIPMWKNSVVFPWISSPHGSLGLAHHRHAYSLWEISDANTQTLSGPLTLIRSLWCLEGQMLVADSPTHSRLTGIGLWGIAYSHHVALQPGSDLAVFCEFPCDLCSSTDH